MSGLQPVAVYAYKVPTGDVMVPAVPSFAAMFRLTMAAIDPSAEPEYKEGEEKKAPRAILKLIRVPAKFFLNDDDDSDDSNDSDYEELVGQEDEDEESSDDDEVNGGPSDPSKTKKPNHPDIVKAIADQESDDEEDDAEEEAAAKSTLLKIMKGKGKATGDDGKPSGDDDIITLRIEESIICTLDPEKHCQQPLDMVIAEDERIFFQVSGTHEVHLTGNFVIPIEDSQAQLYGNEDEDDYDLSPDEEALDALEDMENEEEESDELDDLADPRIMEVDTDEEVPKLVKPAAKGKNKRPAEDSDEEGANLDEIMAKSIKPSEPTINGEEKPMTKSEKKKLKKLKKNDGEAAPVEATKSAISMPEPKAGKKSPEDEKKEPATNGDKKVQFAKNLEQGPTPSATPPTKDTSKETTKSTGSLGIKEIQGVTVDDRKLGTGPQAKKGSHVDMRYIGKLENGKVFDANKKGKPFGFKLGVGEVIKGWDIGVMGMAVGGERRLTIPASLAYGSKGAPPKIPPNSRLIFDIKALGVK